MGDIGIDAKELSDPADYVCSLAWSGFEQGLSQACA